MCVVVGSNGPLVEVDIGRSGCLVSHVQSLIGIGIGGICLWPVSAHQDEVSEAF